MDDTRITDEILLNALRKRIMRDIEAGGQGSIINNIGAPYGEAPGGIRGAALADQAAPVGPDDTDYWVEIAREDLGQGDPWDPEDPGKGNVRGEKAWRKLVHRYAEPRGPKGSKPGKRKAPEDR